MKMSVVSVTNANMLIRRILRGSMSSMGMTVILDLCRIKWRLTILKGVYVARTCMRKVEFQRLILKQSGCLIGVIVPKCG